jgi:hypothetical protein
MNIQSTYGSIFLFYSLKYTYTYSVKNNFIEVYNFLLIFVLH